MYKSFLGRGYFFYWVCMMSQKGDIPYNVMSATQI